MIYFDMYWNRITLKDLSEKQIRNELNHYAKNNDRWSNTHIFILNDVLNKRRMNKLKKLL